MVDPRDVRDSLGSPSNEHLRSMLFPYGFLITQENEIVEFKDFPFYGAWTRNVVRGYQFLVHPDQTLYFVDADVRTLFLLGHAYDPMDLIYDEVSILNTASAALSRSTKEFLEAVSRLTGVFALGVLEAGELTVYGDAAGMQTVFYGEVKGVPYVTSHATLVATLCQLEVSDYVARLTSSRFYHLFGRALPGDLSAYAELTRLVPNFSVSWDGSRFSPSRFFLLDPIVRCVSEEDLEGVVVQAAEILRNSMALVAKKWQMPAISLTGGCDSQTTLACAAGHYDRFRYFSYASSPEELVDARAAGRIAAGLGLQHETIPVDLDEFRTRSDFETVSVILELNGGNIGPERPTEVAKRLALRESSIQVEVKSWVSEVTRCYYHKRFLKRRFPNRPTPRYLTTLYKVFLDDRRLVRMTDQVFRRYLEKYCSDGVFDRADWWDVVFWEYRVGAWNGPVISGDHRFSFAIDIPYNNRILLQVLLGAPVLDRVADRPHRLIRELGNPELDRLGVSVVNVKHTSTRARLERIYLELHSRLPA